MLKRFMPKSLLSRFILIIMIPTILTQIIAIYIFYSRHWSTINRHMIESLSGEIALIVKIRTSNLPYETINTIENKLPIFVTSSKDKEFINHVNYEDNRTINNLYDSLIKKINYPINIKYNENKSALEILIKIPNEILIIEASRKRIENSTTYIFILWMTCTAIIFFIISIIFSKNQIRPIIRLARAAELFGKGREVASFEIEGAFEVRKASRAFLKMKERIERQISKRTEMLNAISHDLRTPLTRMRLSIAMSKDKNLKMINDDIIEMENMINAYLNYVRGEEEEITKQISAEQFFEEIINYYPKNQINLQVQRNIFLIIKIKNFSRAIKNLINNSLYYAQKININCYQQEQLINIEIEDNGPGIKESEYKNVFKPFYRIESARNKDKNNNVGLGLTIARDIISNHGGEISLSRSIILGGLKVTIKLPI